jgi:Asp-tRNA(Asn)/Glu-tRNA(Gln) amidotransferase A subunit family amidase
MRILMTRKPRSLKLDRRSFVKLLPAAGVATLGVSAVGAQGPPVPAFGPVTTPQRAAEPTPSAGGAQQQGRAQAPQKVNREMLHTAEQLIGIELTEAQENMALSGVNRNLASYEALRGLDIPLDTEPAFAFHPALPGKKFNRTPAQNIFSRPQPPAFKSAEELAFCSALQLAELLRLRKVTSTELTKMYLERLKRYSPKLNCLITLTEELALKQAEQADREIRAGRFRSPLHGVPCGVKDLFATKGIKTTWGAEPYRDQMIDYDATVIERLRAAGAVLLAKLSMGALAMGGNWYGGMTRNPWNTEQGSSGSSAGSASTTAAGLVGFSLGTETLGSIITPCSICGVVGLRPSYGRISRYGAMGLCWTMDKIGTICRAVEDCAAVLHLLYGPDNHDLTVSDVPFRWRPARPLASMRIGYQKEEFEQGSDERKALYAAALEVLRKAGAKLEPITLPKFNAGNIRFLLNTEAAAAFDDLTRNKGIDQLSGQAAGDWPNVFRTHRFVPAVEYIRAMRARTLLMRQMDELMSHWDVFVSTAPSSSSLLITNLTGHPAVTMPCGFERGPGGPGRASGEAGASPRQAGAGLPRAIMFTAGLYDEAAALRVALAFERATNWHTMHPKEFQV